MLKSNQGLYLLPALLITVAALFIVLGIENATVSGKTITVDDDPGDGDFSRIQDAIDAAEDGDTIRVYAGTYYETVLVNKSVYMIGNGSVNTFVEGDGERDIIKITANDATITGFHLNNSGSWDEDGRQSAVKVYGDN